MGPVTSLTITYDARCGLCTSAKDWILRQEPLVGVEFLASGSAEARRRFPQLPPGELAVVGDTGEVWLGNHSWIVCLWALRDYRDLAYRLSSPFLKPMARQAFALVSRNRAALSNLLGLRSERLIERELKRVALVRCETKWLD